jgi:hypothetical protein
MYSNAYTSTLGVHKMQTTQRSELMDSIGDVWRQVLIGPQCRIDGELPDAEETDPVRR